MTRFSEAREAVTKALEGKYDPYVVIQHHGYAIIDALHRAEMEEEDGNK